MFCKKGLFVSQKPNNFFNVSTLEKKKFVL